MSSNFENGYNWSNDMQPQNLSRYPSDPTSNNELEVVPQDYIHLFPSPLPEGSDESLLKRSDLSAPYQDRPVNLAAFGDCRHIDTIYPDLTDFDALHHHSSISSSMNNNYGNYNVFSHIFPHNPPENYVEDRFLNLGTTDVEGNEEHSGNFVNNLETQFCPPLVSPLIYSSGFQVTESEDNITETEIHTSDGVQMTAVLDLSPTVSAINKSSQAEGFVPYILTNDDAAKLQLRQSGTYSTHPIASEINSFKNNCSNSHSVLSVKYEPPNSASESVVPLPLYEEPIPNPSLPYYDVDHAAADLRELTQPKRLMTKSIRDTVDLSGSSPEFSLEEERSFANKTYVERDPYRDLSLSYLGCEPSSLLLCNTSKSQKVVDDSDTSLQPIDRVDYVVAEAPLQIRPHKYSAAEMAIPFNPKENSKPLNYDEQRESDTFDKTLKDIRPVKKSERLRKAKPPARMEEGDDSSDQIQKKKKKKQVVTCRTCSAQFSEWHSLKIHYYSHTGEHPFCCDECGIRFTKNSSLSVHRLKHTGEKPHSCSTCGRSFRLFSTLKSHLLTHTGEKPFRCDLCLAKFTQRSALKRHKKKHMNLKPYKCDLCGNSFRDKFYFNKHIACHEMKAKHSCEVCGEGFYSNKKLQSHAMKHNEGPNPYKCNKCTAEFVSRKAWRQHKSRSHERKEELRCEDCDATFKRRESFNAHKKVHSGENLIKCEFCQANFNNIRTLRKHTKKHENNSYSNKKNSSNRETNIVNPISSGEVSFPCVQCNRTFSTRRQLRTHKCFNKCDDSIQSSSKGDTNKTYLEAPVKRDINALSLLVIRRDDTLPSSLSPASPASSSIDEPSDSEIRVNNELRVNFNQTASTVGFQVSNRNLKVQSRSDNHLILAKSSEPQCIPQESNAASLLSAVLEVADSRFNTKERNIL